MLSSEFLAHHTSETRGGSPKTIGAEHSLVILIIPVVPRSIITQHVSEFMRLDQLGCIGAASHALQGKDGLLVRPLMQVEVAKVLQVILSPVDVINIPQSMTA